MKEKLRLFFSEPKGATFQRRRFPGSFAYNEGIWLLEDSLVVSSANKADLYPYPSPCQAIPCSCANRVCVGGGGESQLNGQ